MTYTPSAAPAPQPPHAIRPSSQISSLFDLTGRVALITRGCRGLGLAIARALGQAGAQLCVAARRRDWLDPALEELAGGGIEATGSPAT